MRAKTLYAQLLRRGTAILGAILVLWTLVVAPRPAFAKKAELAITKLELPEDSAADFEKRLRRMIRTAGANADFGKGKKVEATFRLKEFKVETTDDLVRVTATFVGRLHEGGTAKSHISFGAKPSKRKSLEKQVLRMVVDGVVTRLAEMARVRQALEERKKKESEAVTVVEPPSGLPRDARRPLPGRGPGQGHGSPADGDRQRLA